jgi:hypothetical protein
VQVRAVCPSPPELLHFWGDRFFDGSDSAIIISNSGSALRMVPINASILSKLALLRMLAIGLKPIPVSEACPCGSRKTKAARGVEDPVFKKSRFAVAAVPNNFEMHLLKACRATRDFVSGGTPLGIVRQGSNEEMSGSYWTA